MNCVQLRRADEVQNMRRLYALPSNSTCSAAAT
jgi:hypothetical protein